ncbi:hypothetical protein [Streptomyces sp. NPDC097610]|uniref:hypothetical protein n=1 Tax=Streptomyces sp. NPDC097610 TaxID=3157227 RepID=UPI00332399C9
MDFVVLGSDLGEGERIERGELGQGFVPFGDASLGFGDLGLESLDLRGAGVDDLACLPQGRKASFELFGRTQQGARACCVFARCQAGC